jgi:membrane associated rhomboid family serine protease
VWIFGVFAFIGSVGPASGISHITHLGGLLTALVLLLGPKWWNRFRGPRGGGRRRGRVEDIYDDPHWRMDQ